MCSALHSLGSLYFDFREDYQTRKLTRYRCHLGAQRCKNLHSTYKMLLLSRGDSQKKGREEIQGLF